MLMHEAGRIAHLTKKAIEYYMQQSLVAPAVLENGYRDFSPRDIVRLQKIAVLRQLGLSAQEMKKVLTDQTGSTLRTLALKKTLHIQREETKKTLLETLSRDGNYEQAQKQLRTLEQSALLNERLLDAFPGYYGQMIAMHFARFLNEPIVTDVQEAAYETILAFLDSTPTPALPQDLQDYLASCIEAVTTQDMAQVLEKTKASIENPEAFLADNREFLTNYLAYKQSDDYLKSPFCRLLSFFKTFNQASGYEEIFLPAMRVLSASYRTYCADLVRAQDVLTAAYPEIEHL